MNTEKRPVLCTTLYRKPKQPCNFDGILYQLRHWILSHGFHPKIRSKRKSDSRQKSNFQPYSDPSSPTGSNAKDYFMGYARFHGNSIIFWFHSLGVYNIRRHGTWGNDVLPPPCWPSEREARIVLLRHHELDPLLPVFFSSTIFSSLHSRQSVHSAHFLQHSVQCCAHRCWVPTVTPFFFWDFLMKTFRIYLSWIVFPLCFTHTVLFQHAPTFSLTHAIYLFIFGRCTFSTSLFQPVFFFQPVCATLALFLNET